jgi:hypothetical protein
MLRELYRKIAFYTNSKTRKNKFRMETYQENRHVALFMSLIFVASASLLMGHHEMWRDEVQAWLVIRDVGSLGDFLKHLKYELHPFFWYALIYPLKFLTHNPEIIKPLHLLIGCTSVYIFCRNAPFSRLNKLLFIFGYFPFFEYGIISRNYSLILLLSFFLAMLYIAVQADFISTMKLWGFTAVIFFICQVHLLGVLIGCVFACLLAWDMFVKKRNKALLPILGFLGGLAVFLVQILPMSSATASFAFDLSLDKIVFTVRSVWRGLFPLPIPFLHFWNTNILDINMFLFNVQSLLALGVLLGSIAFIVALKELRAIIFYLIGVCSLLGIIYLVECKGVRIYGFFFMLFILSLWIGYGLKGSECKNKLISVLLLFHVVATPVAYYYDMRYPFSSAIRAAGFIKYLDYQDSVIIGYRNAPVSSLSGYLNAKIFYPQTNQFGSFTVFDSTYFVRLKTSEVIQKAEEIRTVTGKPVVVVLNYMPKETESINTSQYSLLFLGGFSISIVASEVYSIWVIK